MAVMEPEDRIMRRFVLTIAMGVLCSSVAAAAAVDQLSSRLKQYDDETPSGRQVQVRTNSATYPENVVTGDPAYPDPHWEMPSGCSGGGCSSGGCSGGGCSGNGCSCGSCSCDDGGCDGSCGLPRSFYGRADYINWWVRGANTPALVTTSPDSTPAGTAGLLPGAQVLFGNDRVNADGRPGGRFTVGYWFGDGENLAVEDTFFFLGSNTQSFAGSSDTTGVLARPFFDTVTGAQDIIYVALPGTTSGSITIDATSKMVGNEVNLRRCLYSDCCHRIDALAGYRYLLLSENLAINSNSMFTSSPPGSGIVVGTTVAASDNFLTRNNFNGGQLGLVSEYYRGRWTLELRGKIALGAVSQRVSINGSTDVNVPGGGTTQSVGGLLALPSNIGNYNRNQFGVLPEFNVNLHYQVNPCWRVNVGYTIFALTNVVRPGDQIDTRIDTNQIPPAQGTGPFTSPAFAFHNSDVLVQGINVGLVHEF